MVDGSESQNYRLQIVKHADSFQSVVCKWSEDTNAWLFLIFVIESLQVTRIRRVILELIGTVLYV